MDRNGSLKTKRCMAVGTGKKKNKSLCVLGNLEVLGATKVAHPVKHGGQPIGSKKEDGQISKFALFAT